MAYQVIDIEGIVVAYANKLITEEIKTVDGLLEKAKTANDRKVLAEARGISEELILTWTNHADLMRIKFVGPQFSELLEAGGVGNVKELKHRVTENLQKKLEEINEQKKLVIHVPSATEIQRMIDQPKELPTLMEHL